MREVTSRIDKDLKVELRETASQMWMACHSQEEIAEAVEVAAGTVVNWESEFIKSSTDEELRNWTNFTPPIYNVWKQQEIAEAIGFGQPAVAEFTKNLQLIQNGTDAENDNLPEKPALTIDADSREFEEDVSGMAGGEIVDSRPQITAQR